MKWTRYFAVLFVNLEDLFVAHIVCGALKSQESLESSLFNQSVFSHASRVSQKVCLHTELNFVKSVKYTASLGHLLEEYPRCLSY